jgi:undecaprenyl-diphosphatase
MLIARQARSTVWLVVGACVLLTVLLITAYPAAHIRRHVDRPIDAWLHDALAGQHTLLRAVTGLGALPGVLVECAVIIALTVIGHRWRAVALTVLGPGIAVVLTEWAIKPVVADLVASYLVFPSGHAAAISSVGTVAAVVLLGPSRPAWPAWARRGIVALLALATAAVSVAVVGLAWHLATDTVGGVCVGVATVLVVARLLDALGASSVATGEPARSGVG